MEVPPPVSASNVIPGYKERFSNVITRHRSKKLSEPQLVVKRDSVEFLSHYINADVKAPKKKRYFSKTSSTSENDKNLAISMFNDQSKEKQKTNTKKKKRIFLHSQKLSMNPSSFSPAPKGIVSDLIPEIKRDTETGENKKIESRVEFQINELREKDGIRGRIYDKSNPSSPASSISSTLSVEEKRKLSKNDLEGKTKFQQFQNEQLYRYLSQFKSCVIPDRSIQRIDNLPTFTILESLNLGLDNKMFKKQKLIYDAGRLTKSSDFFKFLNRIGCDKLKKQYLLSESVFPQKRVYRNILFDSKIYNAKTSSYDNYSSNRRVSFMDPTASSKTKESDSPKGANANLNKSLKVKDCTPDKMRKKSHFFSESQDRVEKTSPTTTTFFQKEKERVKKNQQKNTSQNDNLNISKIKASNPNSSSPIRKKSSQSKPKITLNENKNKDLNSIEEKLEAYEKRKDKKEFRPYLTPNPPNATNPSNQSIKHSLLQNIHSNRTLSTQPYSASNSNSNSKPNSNSNPTQKHSKPQLNTTNTNTGNLSSKPNTISKNRSKLSKSLNLSLDYHLLQTVSSPLPLIKKNSANNNNTNLEVKGFDNKGFKDRAFKTFYSGGKKCGVSGRSKARTAVGGRRKGRKVWESGSERKSTAIVERRVEISEEFYENEKKKLEREIVKKNEELLILNKIVGFAEEKPTYRYQKILQDFQIQLQQHKQRKANAASVSQIPHTDNSHNPIDTDPSQDQFE